jgi:hypothetical protein
MMSVAAAYFLDWARLFTRVFIALMTETIWSNGKENVGVVREFEHNGRPAKSGIWKSPVAGRIAARGINLDGDDQADRKSAWGTR